MRFWVTDTANGREGNLFVPAGMSISYIIVKGGPNHALYEINSGVLTSDTTYHIDTNDLSVGNGNHPAISHVTVYYSGTPTEETTEISVTKEWEGITVDADTPSVTVWLTINGSRSSQYVTLTYDNLSASFTNLPAEDEYGDPYAYGVEEDSVAGFTTGITGNAEDGFTVTNTKDPSTTHIWVHKFYDANGNGTKDPPGATEYWLSGFTFELYFGGGDPLNEPEEGDWSLVDTLTTSDLGPGNEGSADFGHQPQGWYMLVEVLTEDQEAEGWICTSENPKIWCSAGQTNSQWWFGNVITEEETTEISVTKEWEGITVDADTPSVTVWLTINGSRSSQYVTLTYDNLSASFTNLPVEDEYGDPYAYGVEEDSVAGFTTGITGNAEDGFTVTNTKEEEFTEISVTKEWEGITVDADTPSVTVWLTINGSRSSQYVTLTYDNLSASFTNLPVEDEYGDPYAYGVEEDSVDGFTTEITGNAEDGFIVTNTKEEEFIDILVDKEWVGDDAGDDVVSVRIILSPGALSIILNDSNSWHNGFYGLLKYDEYGEEIDYSISEVSIDGYESRITGNAEDGFTVTNTRSEIIDLPVTKIWVGDEDDVEHDDIMVLLYANGSYEGASLVLGEDNDWHDSFTDLDKYDVLGEEIIYTIRELGVDGYDVSIDQEDFVITNTRQEEETIDLNGEKIWLNDTASVRPDSIVIRLYADGELYDTLRVSGSGRYWEWEFMDLPRYTEDDGELREIVYSVRERSVSDYDTVVSGTTIYNTYDPPEEPPTEPPTIYIPPTEPPTIDIPPVIPPTTDIPPTTTTIEDPDVPLIDIFDNEVPLADAPETGDNRALALILLLAALSMVALTTVLGVIQSEWKK